MDRETERDTKDQFQDSLNDVISLTYFLQRHPISEVSQNLLQIATAFAVAGDQVFKGCAYPESAYLDHPVCSVPHVGLWDCKQVLSLV